MPLSESTEARAWGILFALFLMSDRAIYGKVRLNKTLSMLQCEGFPVTNRFVNIQMGPADINVESDAEELERRRLITIEDIPAKVGKQAGSAYRLRNPGLEELRKYYTSRIENLPYKDVFSARLEEIRTNFQLFNTDEIVNKVHKELLIDVSPEEFGEHSQTVMHSLKQKEKRFESRFDESCPICLEVLGCTDFAYRALNEVVERHLRSRESGKNMAFLNAKWIDHWAAKLADHKHIEDFRPGDTPETGTRKHIGHRLYCLEQIAGLYGIASPIVDESDLCEAVFPKIS